MKTRASAGGEWPGGRIAKAILIVVLAAMLFLLGQSMARHRFHQGGRHHSNGSVGQ